MWFRIYNLMSRAVLELGIVNNKLGNNRARSRPLEGRCMWQSSRQSVPRVLDT